VAHADADEAVGASHGGFPSTVRDAPHPHPSRGAGGPRQRAAGRVLEDGGPSVRRPTGLRPAVLLEPDPLLRPTVEAAVRRLGFEPGLTPAPVLFVNLGGLGVCPSFSCGLGHGPAGGAGLGPTCRSGRGDAPNGASVIGYVAGRPLTGAAHVLHGCCAQVLELRPAPGGPALVALVLPAALAAPRPTRREADVLALLLAGATDRRAAAMLGVAPSTVRTHARAVLRKVGVADRRQLRRLDARPEARSAASLRPSGPVGGCGRTGP